MKYLSEKTLKMLKMLTTTEEKLHKENPHVLLVSKTNKERKIVVRGAKVIDRQI